MGLPTLEQPDYLDYNTRRELEALLIQLEGYLLIDHKADGKHKSIRADSLAVAKVHPNRLGTITAEGNISTESDVRAEGDITAQYGSGNDIRLGLISEPTVNDGVAGYGLTVSNATQAQFSIYSTDEGADEFLLFRLGNSIPLRIHKTGGAYFIEPGDATNVLTPVSLGHTLESFGSGRFAAVYANTLDANGLVFPATQVSSSNANTLDDYEEGSWTPVLGGSGGTSGQTYTTQVGRYVKIGRLVTVQFTLVLSNKGTITGTCEIQGLPFTAENASSLFSVGAIQFNVLATNWVNVIGVVIANTTTALVRGNTAAATGNATDLVTADIANTTQLVGTLTYRASA